MLQSFNQMEGEWERELTEMLQDMKVPSMEELQMQCIYRVPRTIREELHTSNCFNWPLSSQQF